VRPAWVDIDLAAFRANLAAIREWVGPRCDVFAVIKANAYGHGLVPIAREALAGGAAAVGVALIEEALELRESGVSGPILVFGAPPPEQAELFVAAGIDATVCTMAFAEALSVAAVARGVPSRVHVKVNTGMNRIGVTAEQAPSFTAEVARLPGLQLAALSSHIASSDNAEFTRHQIDLLRCAAAAVREAGVSVPMLHIAASSPMLRYRETHLDAVRPGIALYGVISRSMGAERPIQLQPVMAIRARIPHVFDVPAGAPVSYGGTFVTERDTRVAVVPVGYTDGIDRRLSNRGRVSVRGQSAPIIGRVCMDQLLIDVTDVRGVAQGDQVTLLGNDGHGGSVDAAEHAAHCDTVVHEIVSRIGPRMPRVYHNALAQDGR